MLPQLLTRLAGILMICVVTLSIIGVATPQFVIEYLPQPVALPTLLCRQKFFFWKSRSMCPNSPTNSVDLKRSAGILGCEEAYDRFMVAYAFTIMGIISSAATFAAFAVSRFIDAVPMKLVIALTAVTLIFFTIAWPTSWAQSYIKQCNRYVKDHKITGVTIYDVKRGDGVNLITAAWALTFVQLFVVICKNFEVELKTVLKKVVVPDVTPEEEEMEKAEAAKEKEAAELPPAAVSTVADEGAEKKE